MSTTAVPAKSTTSIELASATERVAAAKVEALEPWAEGKAGHEHGMLPRKRERRPDALRGARVKSRRCGEGILEKRQPGRNIRIEKAC